MNPVLKEINSAQGGICLLGFFPSSQDLLKRKLFWEFSPAGSVLKNALAERGLRREKLNLLVVNPTKDYEKTDENIEKLRIELQRLRPSVVVAFGNEASWTLCPTDWPTGKSSGRFSYGGGWRNATGIEELRGFIFDSPFLDCPVLPTMHPLDVVKSWTPWRVLLSLDLQRAKTLAKDGFERPLRKVMVI